jgi:hypothetical protein
MKVTIELLQKVIIRAEDVISKSQKELRRSHISKKPLYSNDDYDIYNTIILFRSEIAWKNDDISESKEFFKSLIKKTREEIKEYKKAIKILSTVR